MKISKSTTLKEVLAIGKKCEMCGHCCKHGAGFIAKRELKKLAKHFKLTEEEFIKKYCTTVIMFNKELFKPKAKEQGMPYGICVFYDDKKGCAIHKIKPLHCRIGNCGKHGEELSGWFTVNCLVNPKDAESIRQFCQYIKAGGKTIPGGQLKDIVKDKERLEKILSYKIMK